MVILSYFLKKNLGAGGVPFQGHRRPNPAGASLGLGLLKNAGKRSAFSKNKKVRESDEKWSTLSPRISS
jgi:hypothetical protein